MTKTEYAGWPNCLKLANEDIEIIITTDVGPRIIYCGFIGDENLFWNDPATLGQTGGDGWNLYGGHRLWHSPEIMPRTYSPDNDPVETLQVADWTRLIQSTEPGTGIQKEMDVRIRPMTNTVEIIHRLRNCGQWEIELAAWALSVMAPGGIGICPQPTTADPQGLLSNRTLILWPYTRMQDPRITWGDQYILMRQDAGISDRLKFGINNDDQWIAYLRGEFLFVKTFEYYGEEEYPDGGASIEMFTNSSMLEAETLSPLTVLEPGDEFEHIETWHLFRGLSCDGSEDCVEACVTPLLKSIV